MNNSRKLYAYCLACKLRIIVFVTVYFTEIQVFMFNVSASIPFACIGQMEIDVMLAVRCVP